MNTRLNTLRWLASAHVALVKQTLVKQVLVKQTLVKQVPVKHALVQLALLCWLLSGCSAGQEQRRTHTLNTGHALVIQLPGLEGPENKRKIYTAIESQWHRSKGARGAVQVVTPSSIGLVERLRSGLLLAKQRGVAPNGPGCTMDVPETLIRLQEVDHARSQGNIVAARERLQKTEQELPCQSKPISPQLVAGILLMQGLLETDVTALAQALTLDANLLERMAAYPTIQHRLEAARQRLDTVPHIPAQNPAIGTSLKLYLDGTWMEDVEPTLIGRYHVAQWVDENGSVLYGRVVHLPARESTQPQPLLTPYDLPPSIEDARTALLDALKERTLPESLRIGLQYVLQRGGHPWILVVGPSAPPKERWAMPSTFKSIDIVPTDELKLHSEPRARPSARLWPWGRMKSSQGNAGYGG